MDTQLVMTPEEKERIRQRVLAGERLDLETSKRIVESLRGERRSAAAAAAASSTKKTRKKGMTDAELDADLDSFLGSPTAATKAGDSAPDLDIS
jgi:hypothetical protein